MDKALTVKSSTTTQF
jgi:hypothetical protein